MPRTVEGIAKGDRYFNKGDKALFYLENGKWWGMSTRHSEEVFYEYDELLFYFDF